MFLPVFLRVFSMYVFYLCFLCVLKKVVSVFFHSVIFLYLSEQRTMVSTMTESSGLRLAMLSSFIT